MSIFFILSRQNTIYKIKKDKYIFIYRKKDKKVFITILFINLKDKTFIKKSI